MVSLNALRALTDSVESAPESGRRRHRREWVRGEVRCLLCARLLGRLLGSRGGHKSADRASNDSISFFAYRSAGTDEGVVRLTPSTRFRCVECGGAGVLDDVDFFSAYDEQSMAAEEAEPGQHGPGRPPRPLRPAQPARQGLALALTTLADEA